VCLGRTCQLDQAKNPEKSATDLNAPTGSSMATFNAAASVLATSFAATAILWEEKVCYSRERVNL
jgi:hypothetical protein